MKSKKTEKNKKVEELIENLDNLTNEVIEKISHVKNHSCTCEQCQGMCINSPCLGTPSDIRKIYEAGYVEELTQATMSAAHLYTGGQIPPVHGVQITNSIKNGGVNGSCPFLKEGLCLLHDKGLKPTEGKLASHGTKQEITQELFDAANSGDLNALSQMMLLPNALVTMSWLSESNQEDVKFIVNKFS